MYLRKTYTDQEKEYLNKQYIDKIRFPNVDNIEKFDKDKAIRGIACEFMRKFGHKVTLDALKCYYYAMFEYKRDEEDYDYASSTARMYCWMSDEWEPTFDQLATW